MSTDLQRERADTGRVEAFSDGVLAIVITLLVLDIKVPQHAADGEAALWQALLQQLPVLGAWALSFFFVLVFWVAHHSFFGQLRHIDRGLLWLNGLFLFFISFTPFPTALLGLYPGSSISVTLLSAVMFLTAGSFSLMRWYATRHARLFLPNYEEASRYAMRRSLLGPGLYLLAIVMALVAPRIAVVVQILVPVLFALPGRAAAAHFREPPE